MLDIYKIMQCPSDASPTFSDGLGGCYSYNLKKFCKNGMCADGMNFCDKTSNCPVPAELCDTMCYASAAPGPGGTPDCSNVMFSGPASNPVFCTRTS